METQWQEIIALLQRGKTQLARADLIVPTAAQLGKFAVDINRYGIHIGVLGKLHHYH